MKLETPWEHNIIDLHFRSKSSVCHLILGAYLKYNDNCTSSSQCDSSLQLVCTNSLCKCNGYYTYNATNSACELEIRCIRFCEIIMNLLGALILNNTLTYGDACVSGSSQCKSSVGLTCSTGNCTCTVTKAWNVSACSCPSGTFLNSSSLCGKIFYKNRLIQV